MDNLEKEKIREIVLNLRKQISNGEIKFPGSENFPLGCCGSASEILQGRLRKNGFDHVQRKVNMWFGNQSHSWLVYKKHIIDITIDQFELTEDLDFLLEERASEFHKQFVLI